MEQDETSYDEASRETVELGNRIADTDDSADIWEIADGLLAGAIQYWLYSRQPCGDPECEDCSAVCTAELRLAELRRLLDEFARTSEYFHAPTDFDAGRA
ncbi:MAG TPA: hypothetical protein VKA32_04225 [Gammaproteobacteria bacterium]|nr:hypothetical protein [Gammaproteobacteria bacterium]